MTGIRCMVWALLVVGVLGTLSGAACIAQPVAASTPASFPVPSPTSAPAPSSTSFPSAPSPTPSALSTPSTPSTPDSIPSSKQFSQASPADSGVCYPLMGDYLLGGWLKDRWVDADTLAGSIPAGLKYLIYADHRLAGAGIGSTARQEEGPGLYWVVDIASGSDTGPGSGVDPEPTEFPETSETSETLDTSDTPETPEDPDIQEHSDGTAPIEGLDSVTMAVGGVSEPLPRLVRLQSGGFEPYRKEIRELLKKNRISVPRVDILQVLRVDLDGNGSDEVFVVAGNADPTRPVFEKNTYSIVLFRRLVKGTVITTILREHYYHEAKSGEADSPSGYTIPCVLDANGDGRMEVFLRGRYYEGTWFDVLEFDGRDLKKVLGAGVGA